MHSTSSMPLPRLKTRRGPRQRDRVSRCAARVTSARGVRNLGHETHPASAAVVTPRSLRLPRRVSCTRTKEPLCLVSLGCGSSSESKQLALLRRVVPLSEAASFCAWRALTSCEPPALGSRSVWRAARNVSELASRSRLAAVHWFGGGPEDPRGVFRLHTVFHTVRVSIESKPGLAQARRRSIKPQNLERDTRFELATSSLGSWHSTN